MIHHSRSTFNEVSSCKAMEIQVLKGLHPSSRNHPIVYRSTLMSQFPSSTKTIRRLLPIQWPQPHNEEICLAMEEAEFEEKREEKRRESLRRKKLRVIEEGDGDGNSNTGSCTDHIPRDKHHPLASKDGDSQEEHDSSLQHEETIHGLVSLFFVYFTFNCFNLHTTIMMVVTISENLKNTGLTTDKKVLTSTVGMKDEAKGKMVQKAKASFTTLASSSHLCNILTSYFYIMFYAD
uniref:Uncharacterized protein n=1 Tax=Brassica oleracea TaxID=3712 RepID=A0A3P6AHR7_BRAOL|nr:unnamed protein product [Brassica oleracea]